MEKWRDIASIPFAPTDQVRNDLLTLGASVEYKPMRWFDPNHIEKGDVYFAPVQAEWPDLTMCKGIMLRHCRLSRETMLQFCKFFQEQYGINTVFDYTDNDPGFVANIESFKDFVKQTYRP